MTSCGCNSVQSGGKRRKSMRSRKRFSRGGMLYNQSSDMSSSYPSSLSNSYGRPRSLYPSVQPDQSQSSSPSQHVENQSQSNLYSEQKKSGILDSLSGFFRMGGSRKSRRNKSRKHKKSRKNKRKNKKSRKH